MSQPLHPTVELTLDQEAPTEELLETVTKALEDAGISSEAFALKATSGDWDNLIKTIEKYVSVTWTNAEVSEYVPDETPLGVEFDDNSIEEDIEAGEDWDEDEDIDDEDE